MYTIYIYLCTVVDEWVWFHLQVTKDPLPAAEVTEVWDNLKDHGVLVGKGGLYGTVRGYTCNYLNYSTSTRMAWLN